ASQCDWTRIWSHSNSFTRYSRAGKQIDVEIAAVEENLGGGSRRGNIGIIELVEEGSRLIEVAEGCGGEGEEVVVLEMAKGVGGEVAKGGEEGDKGEVQGGGKGRRRGGEVPEGAEEGERGELVKGREGNGRWMRVGKRETEGRVQMVRKREIEGRWQRVGKRVGRE
ncbi:hypothetical protein L195_g026394, partial [Trifolium pratense]